MDQCVYNMYNTPPVPSCPPDSIIQLYIYLDEIAEACEEDLEEYQQGGLEEPSFLVCDWFCAMEALEALGAIYTHWSVGMPNNLGLVSCNRQHNRFWAHLQSKYAAYLPWIKQYYQKPTPAPSPLPYTSLDTAPVPPCASNKDELDHHC